MKRFVPYILELNSILCCEDESKEYKKLPYEQNENEYLNNLYLLKLKEDKNEYLEIITGIKLTIDIEKDIITINNSSIKAPISALKITTYEKLEQITHVKSQTEHEIEELVHYIAFLTEKHKKQRQRIL